MKKILIIIAALFLGLANTAISQNNDLSPRFGIYGHFGLNMHSADFQNLPDIPNCCPNFQDGSGTGLAFGALYETPIAKNLLLGLRAGYMSLDGKLTETESTMMFVNNVRQMGEFEHNIDATLDEIGLNAYLGYQVIDNLFLYGGLRLGFAMTSDFEQVETISQPENTGTFLDADGNNTFLRTRNYHQGKIPDASSTHLFAFAGLGYELPLNSQKSWILAPELFYYFGLFDIPGNTTWSVDALNLGLALKYSPRGRPGRDYSIKPKLLAGVVAYGIDEKGNEKPMVTIKVEEFSSLELHPLLTYVFFDKNSSDIPARYNKLDNEDTGEFSEDDLYKNQTLEIYHDLLNIIGRRMTDNPKKKITLVGCNDNEGDEKGDKKLSKARANEVKDYLTSVWNIQPNRIRIKTRNLPKQPSNIKEADGIEENRRVEIQSNSWEIIKPVICYDTTRVCNPRQIRFYPTVESNEGLKAWYVAATMDDEPIKEFKGSDIPDKSLNWDLKENTPDHDGDLNYFITAENASEMTMESDIKSIPVEVYTIHRKRAEKIKDKEVQKFSLILFDFNKANISSLNKKIVEIIKERIAPNSVVTITGHTDRIGDEEVNSNLSDRRAKSVDKALGHANSDAKGIGERNLLYDNNLPEGRFYCRTVNVLVETDIE